MNEYEKCTFCNFIGNAFSVRMVPVYPLGCGVKIIWSRSYDNMFLHCFNSSK